MIDFEPTEEQALIIDTVHQFAENEIRPFARESDESGKLAPNALSGAHELGLIAIGLPEEYDGGGQPSATLGCLIAEELAWGDLSTALAILSPSLLAQPIARLGSEEQKARILPSLAGPDFVPGALAAAEPRFDSDLHRPQTTARVDGDGYRIEGIKCQVPWIDGVRDVIVLAECDGDAHAFLVPRDAEGLTVEAERNLGTHALPLVELNFSGVQVPLSARLGDDGGTGTSDLIARGRVGMAACAVGMSRAALEIACEYAKERETFGAPIATRQSIAFKIADMAIEIDGARLLAWEAACALDEGKDAGRLASLAYTQARRVALKVSDDAVQIFGGHGFIRDYLPEMYLRNAGGFISSFEALTLV